MGTRLCPVMPGDVFTSSNHGSLFASSIRSIRPQSLQPTTLKALSDSAFSASSFCDGSPQGQRYFVSSVKY